MWWLHSLWAMGWGTFIVFTQKGFIMPASGSLLASLLHGLCFFSFSSSGSENGIKSGDRKEKVKSWLSIMF